MRVRLRNPDREVDLDGGRPVREVLRELGAMSSRSGLNGFAFGRLHGLEQARAAAEQDRWRAAAHDVRRPRRVRWLG